MCSTNHHIKQFSKNIQFLNIVSIICSRTNSLCIFGKYNLHFCEKN